MITITLNGRRATASNLEPLYIGNENSIPVQFIIDPTDQVWSGALLVAIFVAVTPKGRRIAQPAVIDETGMTSIPDKILYYSGSQVGVGLRGTFETNEEVASNLASIGVSIDGAGGEVLSDIDITEEDESVFAQFTDMIADFMDQANDRIEDAEEAVGEIGDRINEAMQPYSTTAELEPMLIYSGTVGTGTVESGATVFTASVAGLTNEAIQDGTKIMLHAQAGSAGDLETVRKLRIGAEGVEGLLYMAQERPETMITYPWSAGAIIIVTAVTVEAARAWRVDDIYQRATEDVYGVVSVQDAIDSSRARLGVAASPFAVANAIKAAVPNTTATDAGKALMVNGLGDHVWVQLEKELPDSETTDAGKVLSVNAAGDPEWSSNVNDRINAIEAIRTDELDLTTQTEYGVALAVNGTWAVSTTNKCWMVPLPDYLKGISIEANDSFNAVYTFLKSTTFENGGMPDFAIGSSRTTILPGETGTIEDIPDDAKYIYIQETYKQSSITYENTPTAVCFSKIAKTPILPIQTVADVGKVVTADGQGGYTLQTPSGSDDSLKFLQTLAMAYKALYSNTAYTYVIDNPAHSSADAHNAFINANEFVIDGNIGASVFVAARDSASWTYEDENYDEQTRSIESGHVYVLRLIDGVLDFTEATFSILMGLISFGLDWKGV